MPRTQNSVENFEDSRSLEIATDNISDASNERNIDNTNVLENENNNGKAPKRQKEQRE